MLKPCPFCGSDVVWDEVDYPQVYMHCKCGINFNFQINSPNEMEAIEVIWNSRRGDKSPSPCRHTLEDGADTTTELVSGKSSGFIGGM